MNRCEYCGQPYNPGVGCTNGECPQRFVYHLRCDCGAPMYERANGGDPNKRTYYCKDCKLYVFLKLGDELDGFYCASNGCVFKGKPTDFTFLEALHTHRFTCPKCSTGYKIRKLDFRQWVELIEKA